VRAAAEYQGLDCVPIIFAERENCTQCETYKMVFVSPNNICADCWVEQEGWSPLLVHEQEILEGRIIVSLTEQGLWVPIST
jgi:hypothetical protein